MVNTKLITTEKEFNDLKESWLELHDRSGGTVFQSYVWNWKWWEIYRQPNYMLRISTYWEDDKLVGILPLFFEQLNFKLVSLSRLRFIGIFETYGEYTPLVDENFKEQIVDSMTEFFIDQLTSLECDIISLFRFSPKSEFMLKLMDNMKDVRIKSRYSPECITRITMELPQSWNEYLNSISSNEKHLIQRRMRIFAREKVELEKIEGDKISDKDFDDFVNLHNIVWEEKGIPGYYTSSKFENFNRELVVKHNRESKSRLYFFKKEALRFAGVHAYFIHDTCCFYLSGMDKHHPMSHQGPGIILLGYVIKDAIDEGYKYFDFQGGDEPYKVRLGGSKTSFAKFEIWRSGSSSYKIFILNSLQSIRRVAVEIIFEKVFKRPLKRLLFFVKGKFR